MTGKGLGSIALAAISTATASLMLREGVTKAGGLSLSLRTLGAEIGQLMRQPLFFLRVVLYGVASLVWFRIVSTEDLNASYPLLVSLTLLFVTSTATLIFRKPLPRLRVVGLLVILVGIVLTTRS